MVKLCDFGCASFDSAAASDDSLDGKGVAAEGCWRFMAPERILARPYSYSVSLCVSLLSFLLLRP